METSAQDTIMREIVVLESLRERSLPPGLKGSFRRRYHHLINNILPVEILELTVSEAYAPHDVLLLAQCLVGKRYYAHVVGEQHMYVVFPGVVAVIKRNDPHSVAVAQAIGSSFAIPKEEMRFAEMFDVDHPDSIEAIR